MTGKLKMSEKELKERLAKDENMWLKVAETANRQHADSLNQLGDLFRLVQGLIERLDKLERKVNNQ